MNNLERFGLLATTSTAADGNMDFRFGDQQRVVEHRARFLKRFGATLETTVVMSVTHEDHVEAVGARDAGRGARERESGVVAEALVTSDETITLMLLTADCIPLVIFDPATHVVALAHAGWKPTLRLLPKKVLTFMQHTYGSDPRSLYAYLAPGIRKASYLLDDVEQKNDPRWSPFIEQVGERYAIDLSASNTHVLTDAGVPPDHIDVAPEDTALHAQYFSHYRSVRSGEAEGRMATIVRLPRRAPRRA